MVAPQDMTLSSTLPLARVNRETCDDDIDHCDDHDDYQVMQSDQNHLLSIRGGPKAVFCDGGHCNFSVSA